MSNTIPGPIEHPTSQSELQQWLENTLGFGSDHIAFQPPSDEKMKRPTWLYRLSDMSDQFADNRSYVGMTCYEIVHISKHPDSKYVSIMRRWPLCRFIRSYQADGLNHWVFRFWTAL